MLRENGFPNRIVSVREFAGANVFLDSFPEVIRKGFDNGGFLHDFSLRTSPHRRQGLSAYLLFAADDAA